MQEMAIRLFPGTGAGDVAEAGRSEKWIQQRMTGRRRGIFQSAFMRTGVGRRVGAGADGVDVGLGGVLDGGGMLPKRSTKRGRGVVAEQVVDDDDVAVGTGPAPQPKTGTRRRG